MSDLLKFKKQNPQTWSSGVQNSLSQQCKTSRHLWLLWEKGDREEEERKEEDGKRQAYLCKLEASLVYIGGDPVSKDRTV